MKKTILLFVIILLSGSVFAQSNGASPAKQKPNPVLDSLLEKMQTMEIAQKRTVKKSPVSVVLKTDTVVYRIDQTMIGYQRIDQLLKGISSFAIDSSGAVSYLGQPVKKIAINGRPYAGLDLAKFIKRLPANLLDNMELIDDYGDAAWNSFVHSGPDKLLNLNIKRSVMEDLEYYLSNRPSRPLYSRGQYDNPDLYGNIYVDEHNPLDRRTNRAIASMLALSDQMHEVDQYGDQIPHFLIPTPYPVKDVMLKRDSQADKDRVPKALRLNP
ncbi:hypothetical protein HQ865_19125 [Mucilaginibacter mali]|uniref:DUF4292 domain-containing protein n=1 Tax=Mucilaginibacter mali TaxID=2740462 RepID=A0A7D4PVQ6_9SPHI|nr:hypothetical protein [Mucilaginibacter mali]QKJ31788.1 hypothetical protein HQ865_19125 [Mucilaginibacter mali]